MADDEYDPFLGFAKKKSPKGTLGAKLKEVDWSAQKAPEAKWVVFNANKMVKQPPKKNAPAPEPGSHRTVAVSEEEAAAWRKENDITVFGDNAPAPVIRFDMLRHLLPREVLATFERQGFEKPTPIQAQSWPVLFSCRDFVGIAKTGSGKTLGFMIPAILHCQAQEPVVRGDGPICLVLAPTRELAQQIDVETRKVLPMRVKSTVIYGGAPKGPQIGALSQGTHILVATPGRLIEMLEIQKTNLTRTSFVVLDEADRMLDMGFEPQVRTICSQIRPDRQTLMFSATWPKEIQELASTFMKNFLRIHVGSAELLANKDVEQRFTFMREDEKPQRLAALLKKFPGGRVIIFVKMKKTADEVERGLRQMGNQAMALHGDKEQHQREAILLKFRREGGTLVATDVAARGIDVKNVEAVINFDFPMTLDDYVHRIGRTARAGAKGISVSFITRREQQLTPWVAADMIKLLEEANQPVPDEFKELAQHTRGRPRPQPSQTGGGAFDKTKRDGPRLIPYSHTNRPTLAAETAPRLAHGGDKANRYRSKIAADAEKKRSRSADKGPNVLFGVKVRRDDNEKEEGEAATKRRRMDPNRRVASTTKKSSFNPE